MVDFTIGLRPHAHACEVILSSRENMGMLRSNGVGGGRGARPRRRRKKPSPYLPAGSDGRKGEDEGGGTVRAGSPRLPRRGVEPARGGAALRHRSEDGGEDAAARSAAGSVVHGSVGAE